MWDLSTEVQMNSSRGVIDRGWYRNWAFNFRAVQNLL